MLFDSSNLYIFTCCHISPIPCSILFVLASILLWKELVGKRFRQTQSRPIRVLSPIKPVSSWLFPRALWLWLLVSAVPFNQQRWGLFSTSILLKTLQYLFDFYEIRYYLSIHLPARFERVANFVHIRSVGHTLNAFDLFLRRLHTGIVTAGLVANAMGPSS